MMDRTNRQTYTFIINLIPQHTVVPINKQEFGARLQLSVLNHVTYVLAQNEISIYPKFWRGSWNTCNLSCLVSVLLDITKALLNWQQLQFIELTILSVSNILYLGVTYAFLWYAYSTIVLVSVQNLFPYLIWYICSLDLHQILDVNVLYQVLPFDFWSTIYHKRFKGVWSWCYCQIYWGQI